MSDIPFPKPAEVTYETVGGTKRVRWDKVEPWLLRIREAGALAVLSKAFGISVETLSAHRREMGLGSLPPGPRLKVDLTVYESEVLKELQSGSTVNEIARKRLVSRQAVSQTRNTIIRKFNTIADKHCSFCGGAGARECGSDGEAVCCDAYGKPNPSHMHVCAHCGGTSSYNANPK